ncbi:MAG: MFS transporter [Candidatus Korobacteraceae bacterium]
MFKSRWWVVIAAILGLIVGSGPIEVYATGVFIKPLSQGLHVGRGVITSAMGLANISTAIMAVVSGRLMDKYGVRPVLLPLLVWFAVVISCFSLLPAGAVGLLMLIFAMEGIGGQTPMPYAKMITARFDEKRGLALGLTLAGSGIGLIAIPQIARYLLQHWGWRTGYVGIGIAVIVLAVIPVSLCFGETPEMKAARLNRKKGEEQRELPGLDFSQVARMPRFWMLVVAFYFANMAINGSLIHVVPMLTDRGIPLSVAVTFMSGAGIAMMVGRVISGYLLDYIFAAYIVIFFLLCPMVGISILGFHVLPVSPAVGVVLLGMGIGSEVDLVAYLVSRYYGVKSFGLFYGIMMGTAAFANASGNNLMGWCYQLTHSYHNALLVMEVMLVIAAVIQATMGPYRYPAMKAGAKPKLQEGAVAQ